MAATRVRVLFEYRNGDGNFLVISPNGGEFVPIKRGKEQEAHDAAYLLALQEIKIRDEQIREHLSKHLPPSHD